MGSSSRSEMLKAFSQPVGNTGTMARGCKGLCTTKKTAQEQTTGRLRSCCTFVRLSQQRPVLRLFDRSALHLCTRQDMDRTRGSSKVGSAPGLRISTLSGSEVYSDLLNRCSQRSPS